MRHHSPADRESTDTTDERDIRALTEYLTVLPDAPDLYEVVSQSGSSYTVDARDGACTCADYEYRQPAGGCKHVRRVEFATGSRPIPDAVPTEAIDEQLGRHVDTDERPVLLADGGTTLGPLPAITEHREPVEQGAAGYHRCEGCGRETIYGADRIVHAGDCPRREARQ